MKFHAHSLKQFAPAKFGQVNHKPATDNFGTQRLDQVNARLRCAASGQKIVNHQDLIARFERVVVDFDGGCTIFQSIGFLNRLAR